jgi:hypothetical protein
MPVITFKVSQVEAEEIRSAARLRRMSVSKYMRMAAQGGKKTDAWSERTRKNRSIPTERPVDVLDFL